MASVDLFTGIHKAVRNLIFTTGLKLQNLDGENGEERAALIQDIHIIFDLFDEHAGNEDRFIFPLVAQYEPQLARDLDGEHRAHAPLVDEIKSAMQVLEEAASAEARMKALARLRIAYFEFIAEHLLHMNHEEREMLPATQRWASDEQLAATLGRIIGGMSPEMYARWMRWMLPALMPLELAGMLRGLASAPPQLLATVEAIAADVLPPARWAQVRAMANPDNSIAA